MRLYGHGVRHLVVAQQGTQDGGDTGFVGARGERQEFEVAAVSVRRRLGDESVVSLPEDRPGKEFLAVKIPREGTGFAHE